MLDNQLTLDVRPYSTLYDIVVPKTHFLRQLMELCDFSFIYNELEKNYCLDFGRRAYSPIMMFKYLLLKDIYQLSDVDVVERSFSYLVFKYFLGLAPEEILQEHSKALRKTIYQYSEDRAADFQNKPQEDNLEAELVYTEKLMAVIEKHDELLAACVLTEIQ